jgi:hypothetical protein
MVFYIFKKICWDTDVFFLLNFLTFLIETAAGQKFSIRTESYAVDGLLVPEIEIN